MRKGERDAERLKLNSKGSAPYLGHGFISNILVGSVRFLCKIK